MLTLQCTPCTIACKLDLTAGQAPKSLLGTCHPGTCHSRSRTPKYLPFGFRRLIPLGLPHSPTARGARCGRAGQAQESKGVRVVGERTLYYGAYAPVEQVSVCFFSK